jgi:hypothetical protein
MIGWWVESGYKFSLSPSLKRRESPGFFSQRDSGMTMGWILTTSGKQSALDNKSYIVIYYSILTKLQREK